MPAVALRWKDLLSFHQRINLITGKGGVGRTVVAVALAKSLALAGRNVLLVETGQPDEGFSPLGQYLGRANLDDEPRNVGPHLDACQLWANTGHELFARSVIPAGPLVTAALRSKPLRRFMNAAPSFYELGILYHFLHLVQLEERGGGKRYDAVVVDMPATGHTLALTSLPDVALRVVEKGPLASAMRRGQGFIHDAKVTAAWVVTLPETLPVSEAIELVDGLRRTRVPVGGILLNRFLPDPFSEAEHRVVDRWMAAEPLRGRFALERIVMAGESVSRLTESTGLPVIRLHEVARDAGDACAGLVAQFTDVNAVTGSSLG
ncbi:MAG: ArsA family ATPase [Deltaproteobacteria bacterium]|nr:ArsA family ATPase [Deltaproteobacteria bacterium]